ncbi:hypothetical protein ACG7TL_008966 [Trametes sanguinea]
MVPLNLIKPIRNVVTFAVDEQHLRRPPQFASDIPVPVEPIEFCVVKRNAISLYSLRERLFFQKEIPLPAGGVLARRSGQYLCIADRENYNVINLDQASMVPLLPISQAMDSDIVVKPSITVISENEFLILSWTGASTLGVFITGEGDPVRGTLEWPGHPEAVSLDYPYITTLLPNNTIEIHSVETQAIVQVIPAPPEGSKQDDRKALIACLNGFFIPSTQRREKLRPTPVRLMRKGGAKTRDDGGTERAGDDAQQGRPLLRGILRRPTVEVDNDNDPSHLRPRNERPISPVAFAPHRFTGPLPPGARILPIPERHRLSEDPVLPTPPISRQTSGGQRPLPPPFDRPPGYYARLYGLLPPDSSAQATPAQATPAQATPAQAPAPQRWSQAGANGAQHAPWWYPFNQPVVQPTPERTTPGHHERCWVVPQTDYVPNAPGITVSTSRRPRLEAILVRDPFNPYHVPSLRWDVRCPPMTAKHITSRATIVPVSRQEWNAPFTKDKSTQAQINMSMYNRPELLGVFPPLHISQSTPITVLELLQYIYNWLQTPVWPREAEDLKTRYPHAWREAEEAFWTRCTTCPHITIPEVERRQGMKRVDLLVRQHIWSGMKRLSSVSSTRSDPLFFSAAPNVDSEEWVTAWKQVLAKELIDSPVAEVDADTSVEEACETLLSKDLQCLAVRMPHGRSPQQVPFYGLFDFADVNAFLTLAATRHKFSTDELREKLRVQDILKAAREGKVPVYLVSNLSEKNPLEILPHDANIISLLGIFCRGAHRVLIQSASSPSEYLGMVSDRALLSWLTTYAQKTPSLLKYLSAPLATLPLPSMYLYMSVVAAKASDTVLDAMKLMSEEGVSSVAVVDDESGGLLSAVSVTDIGKVVVPAQSNQILTTPLQQLVARIKASPQPQWSRSQILTALLQEPDGSTDGVDKFPVYSVTPNSTLFYTMQKLLATNAHRVFVTEESPMSSSPSFSSVSPTNLCGIVSVVDVLSFFARLANIADVDPTRMQRHRRASSTSSGESFRSSGSFAARSRSSSRTSLQRLGSVGSFEGFQMRWAERVPVPEG